MIQNYKRACRIHRKQTMSITFVLNCTSTNKRKHPYIDFRSLHMARKVFVVKYMVSIMSLPGLPTVGRQNPESFLLGITMWVVSSREKMKLVGRYIDPTSCGMRPPSLEGQGDDLKSCRTFRWKVMTYSFFFFLRGNFTSKQPSPQLIFLTDESFILAI